MSLKRLKRRWNLQINKEILLHFKTVFSFLACLLVSLQSHSKVLDINLAAFSETKSVYRGALIWDGPSFFAGPSFVFYKKLALRGPSIIYSQFKRRSKFKLNGSFFVFNDRSPFIRFTGRDEDFRNSRSSSFHFQIEGGYKFGFMNLFELGSKVSYEFREYFGWYLEPFLQMPVAPFVKLNLELGIGESSSNQYLYGQSAVSGLGYTSMGLIGFVPLKVGKLIISASRVSVSKRENRRAFLVGGEPDNFNFAIRYFVKVY